MNVDVSRAMDGVTMVVTVRPVRIWLLKLRVLIGMWLIVAGAKTMGVGTIEIVQKDDGG